MGAQPFSIETYLTVQILEMIGLGPLHALTWAGKMDLDHWLQMSVHGGQTNYLMIQCVLPERVNKGRVDRAFGHTGWIHFQADRRDCLVYYLARSESQWDLRE